MKSSRLILVAVIILFLSLLAWDSIIYVPEIKGRVVDVETKKPMQGVNVRIRWVNGYADPGGGHGGTFKVFATKTDANGQFVLPRTIKPKIPIIESYRGEQIVVYEHGYVHKLIDSYTQFGKVNNHEIVLEPIEGDKQYNENLQKLIGHLFSWFKDSSVEISDHKFVIDDFKAFIHHFPDSKLLEETYYELAAFYETEMKDYKSALSINVELINRFPHSAVLNSVKHDIERLNRLITSSSKRKGKHEE